MLITKEQLTEALASVSIWVRPGPNQPVAWRMHVLHPKDAADDIFTSIRVRGENDT